MNTGFSVAKRVRCKQCLRPQSHCLCAIIQIVENRTKVLVLQHPDEQKHPLNTARLAVLGLQHAEILIGERFECLYQRVASVDTAVLLFPASEHSLVQTLAPLPANQSSLLIVPDGTWRNVRSLVQQNPLLQSLPRLSLPLGEPSLYRIRKARDAAAVSTIEAIVRALTVLEPESDFSPVLRPFQYLIEQQIEAMGTEVYARNYC